jgi:hypothetical protein
MRLSLHRRLADPLVCESKRLINWAQAPNTLTTLKLSDIQRGFSCRHATQEPSHTYHDLFLITERPTLLQQISWLT